MNNENAVGQPASRPSFLATVGVNVPDANAPFWKPTGRPRRVRVVAVRAPADDEKVKQLPDQVKEVDGKRIVTRKGDKITLLAFADVLVDDVVHVWEISSRRAAVALDEVLSVTGVPVDVTVQMRGEGTSTSYHIAVAKDEPKATPASNVTPSGQKKCPAPGCVMADGHAKRHMTAVEFEKEFGAADTTKATTLEA